MEVPRTAHAWLGLLRRSDLPNFLVWFWDPARGFDGPDGYILASDSSDAILREARKITRTELEDLDLFFEDRHRGSTLDKADLLLAKKLVGVHRLRALVYRSGTPESGADFEGRVRQCLHALGVSRREVDNLFASPAAPKVDKAAPISERRYFEHLRHEVVGVVEVLDALYAVSNSRCTTLECRDAYMRDLDKRAARGSDLVAHLDVVAQALIRPAAQLSISGRDATTLAKVVELELRETEPTVEDNPSGNPRCRVLYPKVFAYWVKAYASRLARVMFGNYDSNGYPQKVLWDEDGSFTAPNGGFPMRIDVVSTPSSGSWDYSSDVLQAKVLRGLENLPNNNARLLLDIGKSGDVGFGFDACDVLVIPHRRFEVLVSPEVAYRRKCSHVVAAVLHALDGIETSRALRHVTTAVGRGDFQFWE